MIIISSILQYAAEGFIRVGNILLELTGEGNSATVSEIELTPKRNWMVSYFGEWPIRWEHGGLVLNIDPCFTIALSSITALLVIGLLWLIYTFYFRRVWEEAGSVKNLVEFHSSPPNNMRDNNYNSPRSLNELSPDAPHGSTGVSEISQEIRRRSPSERLCRKPAAVNIQPIHNDMEVKPVPRTPFQTEAVRGEELIEDESPCITVAFCDQPREPSIEDSSDEEGEHQNYEYQEQCSEIESDEQTDNEEAEEFASVDCEEEKENFYEIAEEDSESSSQTEYERYNERGDAAEVPSSNYSSHGVRHGNVIDEEEYKQKERIQHRRSTLVDSLLEISVPSEQRVVLHQFQRGRSGSVPCLAPFAMKLETYLRMAEIEYNVIFDCDSTGPWLTYHNEDFKGASSCMQFLRQVFPSQTENFSPSPDMNVVSWFITILVEYHLYWELIIWRWIINEGRDVLHNQPNWNSIFPDPKEVSDCVKLGAQYHGFGHISESITDVKKAVIKDLEALSESLGEKDFLTGTAPKEVDCSAFAILSQLLWSSTDPIFKANMKLFPANLIRYCERMKSILWSDWDELLSKHEEFSTNVAIYNSSTETSPVVSPRRASISNGSFGDFKSHPKSFVFRLPHSLCTERTEVFVRKTFTENQYWNISNFNMRNLTNPLSLCTEEYFDENLEDMESIKMKSLHGIDGDYDDEETDNPEYIPELYDEK